MKKLLILLGLAVVFFPPAAIAGVEATTPSGFSATVAPRGAFVFAVPRGVVVEMPYPAIPGVPTIMHVEMISDGNGRLVLLESEEGQRIFAETEPRQPSNLRSDGTVRGRQHHSTDFPPRR